jgi:hypothetical protein
MEDNQSDIQELRSVSYNCRGFNDVKGRYLSGLLCQSDIMFFQEHLLSASQIESLADLSADYLATGISGFDKSEVLRGWPYGGCAILWRRDSIICGGIIGTGSSRVCAMRAVVNNVELLLINVAYIIMPCEGNVINSDDFLAQLSVISSVIEQNANCEISDFNVDFSRS